MRYTPWGDFDCQEPSIRLFSRRRRNLKDFLVIELAIILLDEKHGPGNKESARFIPERDRLIEILGLGADDLGSIRFMIKSEI